MCVCAASGTGLVLSCRLLSPRQAVRMSKTDFGAGSLNGSRHWVSLGTRDSHERETRKEGENADVERI